jgi:hypothetical protein
MDERIKTLEEVEIEHVWNVLRACDWLMGKAAKQLGLAARTVEIKLQKYDKFDEYKRERVARHGSLTGVRDGGTRCKVPAIASYSGMTAMHVFGSAPCTPQITPCDSPLSASTNHG